MPPEASFPGCVPGGGAGVLLLLPVLLETSSGRRWVAGQAAGMKTPENFQDADGVLGFYLLMGTQRSCPNAVVSGSVSSWQPVCTSISAPLVLSVLSPWCPLKGMLAKGLVSKCFLNK